MLLSTLRLGRRWFSGVAGAQQVTCVHVLRGFASPRVLAMGRLRCPDRVCPVLNGGLAWGLMESRVMHVHRCLGDVKWLRAAVRSCQLKLRVGLCETVSACSMLSCGGWFSVCRLW